MNSIKPEPFIDQPPDVFTSVTYREFLEQWKQVGDEYQRLYDIHMTYPKGEMRLNCPEAIRMEPLFEELKRFAQEYRRRLPIRLTARCPYCGEKILQPVDFFSLIGYFSPCPNSELYRGSLWYYKVPFRKVCDHAVIMTYAVNLRGLVPNDIVKQGLRLQSEVLDSAPLVIVWPLVA